VLYHLVINTRIKRYAASASATALIEFSLILPVLVIMLMSTFELSRFIEFKRHAAAYAQTLVRQFSSFNTNVTNYDLWSTNDVALWIVPEYTAMRANKGLFNYNDTGRGVQITSVSFQPSVSGCTSSCTYTTGKVMWYYTSGSIGTQRQCGTPQTSVAMATTTPDNTIPSGYFNKGGLVIVDIMLTYTPVFSSVIPERPVYATAYGSPIFYPDSYIPVEPILYNAGATCP
jgi:Flp pilus assembly protein TadG